ncbi:MAG: type I methionyl aminopeptidase [Patescibacteria group bacterium]
MLDKKTDQEILILKEGGHKLALILEQLAAAVKPGTTGITLDRLASDLIQKAGGQPAFKNYRGFPYTLCVSLNNTVVHGLPDDTQFQGGDIVGLDIGMKYKGLYTDMATTVGVGKISPEAKTLLKVTQQALTIGIGQVGPDNYIGDIGRAIAKFIKPFGFGIVKDLAGHGVGRQIHEDPMVPNYDPGFKMDKMFPGLVIAIEPMIIASNDDRVIVAEDGWAVQSYNHSLTAHFEHTVAVTDDGYLILTE